MKHMLGGVAMVAVLAITAPSWAQNQNQNSPPQAGTRPATAPITQPAQPNTAAPQAQTPTQQQNQNSQAEPRNQQNRGEQQKATGRERQQNAGQKEERQNAGQKEERQNAGRKEERQNAGRHEERQNAERGTARTETEMRMHRHRYYGRGMAYRMRERSEHWRVSQEWRMHHQWRMHHHWRTAEMWRMHRHWGHLHAWRMHHHWRYARQWGWGNPYGYSMRYRWHPEWRYGWRHEHWPTDFMAERLNAQELATLGATGMTVPNQYYGASVAPMGYAPAAGYGTAPPAIGYRGTVLWYPPGTNPPSPPGFPPAFYGTWAW